ALLALTLPTAAIRADDGSPTAVSIDDPTYVGDPPPCGTTGEATLSVIDCVGVDQVPSLDETANPGGGAAGAAAAATPVCEPGTEAGIEARRRMAAAGYDVASGETWAINELSSAVRRNTGAARANMAELIRALHDADGTLPAAQGIVFVIGIDQDLADVSTYK